MVAWDTGIGLLYDDNFGRPGHSLGRELRVGELGVLSREV